MKRWDAILSADLHLRSTTPNCRIDDFIAEQFRKLEWIQNLSSELGDIPILFAGDFGDKPKWGDTFLELAMDYLKSKHIYTIPGQHDLPNHNLDLYKGSALSILEKDGYIKVLLEPTIINDFVIYPFPYGTKIESPKSYALYTPELPSIAIIHDMIIKNKPLWPGQSAKKAIQLLKKHKEFDLILSGDNHKPFTEHYDNRKLVNPGSVMRTNIIQINHKPRVYLWNKTINEIKRKFIPINEPEFSMSKNITEVSKADRKKFIARLINKLKHTTSIKKTFEYNIENKIRKNKVSKRVENIIWEHVK